jgi:6-phosphofructokinase 1
VKKRVGILTGGGDAPGLNGVIESCCRGLLQQGWSITGIQDGFEGVFEKRTLNITEQTIKGIHAEAGTLLGTSNKSPTLGREREFVQKFAELNLDGLIAIGGDGTFGGIQRMSRDLKLIGVPKTIDNDLQGTDITFGYDTACSMIAESVDALRYTAEAHKRVIIIEAMGRTAGWIALGGGLAGYADMILIPERPFRRGDVARFISSKKAKQRGMVIVVSEGASAEGENPEVAFRVEGAPQADRYGGIAYSMAKWIEKTCGWESRHVVPGHLQRSRAPTTTDRFLTLAMGIEAARMVMENAWNLAVVYRDGRIQRAPIEDLMKPARLVDPNHRWVKLAQAVGIFI